MKSLRILLLMHEDLIPPEDVRGLADDVVHEFKLEYDVRQALGELGHDVHGFTVVCKGDRWYAWRDDVSNARLAAFGVESMARQLAERAA